MKNVKIPNKVATSLERRAYLDIIHDSIKKLGEKYHIVHLTGYENDNQRVAFQYAGKKCKLYAVSLPDFDKGTIVLVVFAKNGGEKEELWGVSVEVRDLRLKTLDRIAYEVYDYCKGEDDRDYEDEVKDTLAGWMDNYRESL